VAAAGIEAMKEFLAGVLATTLLALLAAAMLDTQYQRSATDSFQTEAVRL